LSTERLAATEKAASDDWLSIRDQAVNELLLDKGASLPAWAPIHAAVVCGPAVAAGETVKALSAIIARCTVWQGEEEPDQGLLDAAPELVLLLAGGRFPRPATLERLKAGGARIAAWTAAPADWPDSRANLPEEVLTVCDCLFLADPDREGKMAGPGGPEVFDLPPAANIRLYFPEECGEEYRSDVLVLGAEAIHAGRLRRILSPLAERLTGRKLVVLSEGSERSAADEGVVQPAADRGSERLAAKGWSRVEAGPEEAARYVNGAALTVNLTPDEETGHPRARVRYLQRLYDAAACGTLQLTPHAPDLASRYAPGQEIAAYASVEELVRLAERYLEDEGQRRDVALAALCRTWQNHTDAERMARLLLSAFPDLSVSREHLAPQDEAVWRFDFPREPALKPIGKPNRKPNRKPDGKAAKKPAAKPAGKSSAEVAFRKAAPKAAAPPAKPAGKKQSGTPSARKPAPPIPSPVAAKRAAVPSRNSPAPFASSKRIWTAGQMNAGPNKPSNPSSPNKPSNPSNPSNPNKPRKSNNPNKPAARKPAQIGLWQAGPNWLSTADKSA